MPATARPPRRRDAGIEVKKDPRLGWSPTTMPAETREAYAVVIADLGAVLRLHRAVEITGGTTKKPATPPCVCGCGRKIRASKTVLAEGPIVCAMCEMPFILNDPSKDLGDEASDDDAG